MTQTWEHDVEFYYERRTAGDTFSFVITTDDEIFWYLNNGTKERYAVMTPDFQPKTHVRTIGSQVGQGGFAYIVDTAVDGIEAREWIDEIANRREDNLHNNMNKIFNHILDVYWNRALRKGK